MQILHSAKYFAFAAFSEIRRSLCCDAVGSGLLTSAGTAYLLVHPIGCILASARDLNTRERGKEPSADDRDLWHCGGLWGLPRRGRWADVGAAPGARDDPQ